MQIWKTYYEDNIDKEILKLSKDKFKLAIVITTKTGEMIPAEKYDAVASQLKNGTIHAFIRIGKLNYENGDLYYDLEHTQLYPENIKEIAVCDRWVNESEKPEEALQAGMKVHITRNDSDEVYDGELTVVTFLDVVVKTAEKEISIPVSKIRTVIVR